MDDRMNELSSFDVDYIKERLILTVINTQAIESCKAIIPHRDIQDISICYRVVVPDEEKDVYHHFLVYNTDLKRLGLSEDELYDLALKNTERLLPLSIKTLNSVIKEIPFDTPLSDEEMDEITIPEEFLNPLVISNTKNWHGACAMFYEGALQKVSDFFKDDVYILPSSRHEVIAVPKSASNPKELADMVKNVNDYCVSANDRLSDHVYLFNAKEKTLTLADTTMEEIKKESAPDENITPRHFHR